MATTSNIVIREATRSDNQGLLELTSITPMVGKIAIRIDRVPDFFRLVELRGPSLVMVAEKDHTIIASYSISFQKVYVNGKPENLSYLADLKVHPYYRKSTIAMRLVRAAFHKISESGADLLYCTVASGNEAVLPFFIPDYALKFN